MSKPSKKKEEELRDVYWAMERTKEHMHRLSPNIKHVEFFEIRHEKNNWIAKGTAIIKTVYVQTYSGGRPEAKQECNAARPFVLRFRDNKQATLRAFKIDHQYSYEFEAFLYEKR